jgi:hypothetical protein
MKPITTRFMDIDQSDNLIINVHETMQITICLFYIDAVYLNTVFKSKPSLNIRLVIEHADISK